MSANSKIEWTDATWTPIRARRKDNGKVGVHCERVSEACKNCYAATFNRRNLPSHGTGLDFVRENREKVDIFVDEAMLTLPMRWRKPRKIFVCSQTDLFAEFVTDAMIDRVFAVMALCPQHTFQVLTKRPGRMMRWFDKPSGLGFTFRSGFVQSAAYEIKREAHFVTIKWPLPNVWLGVTAEDQQRADERIPLLLQAPAARRFVSVEPTLGPVDLQKPWLEYHRAAGHSITSDFRLKIGVDWIIAGGESGHGARPSHPDWFRSLRDQCVAAGVPFFHKQNGEHAWVGRGHGGSDDIEPKPVRIGKQRAGRRLDGVEWSQFPDGGKAC